VLQNYRLRLAIAAQRLDSDRLSFESFDAGELLIVLSEEDGRTTFCRWDDSVASLDGRPRFITGSAQFERWTEPT
jgi:hypothetical protein